MTCTNTRNIQERTIKKQNVVVYTLISEFIIYSRTLCMAYNGTTPQRWQNTRKSNKNKIHDVKCGPKINHQDQFTNTPPPAKSMKLKKSFVMCTISYLDLATTYPLFSQAHSRAYWEQQPSHLHDPSSAPGPAENLCSELQAEQSAFCHSFPRHQSNDSANWWFPHHHLSQTVSVSVPHAKQTPSQDLWRAFYHLVELQCTQKRVQFLCM